MTLVIACLYAGVVAFSEQAPVISKDYSNEQIEKMISAYKSAASKDIIPNEALMKKFKEDFPQAKDIEWETAVNINEVEFEIGKVDYKAYYDAEGKLLMYFYELPAAKLPKTVRDAALKAHSGFVIDDVKIIHHGTVIYYRLELEQGEQKIKELYKTDGTLVTPQ